MDKKKKILVIDDDDDIRQTLSELFILLNYKCVTADSGTVGIKTAKKEKPDLIICDIMMPNMDGFGVLNALNKIPETSNIPFIFLTAKGELSDFRKGMELGADDYLSKPFTVDELTKAIDVRFSKHEKLKKMIEEKSESNFRSKKIQKDSHIILMVSNHPESVKVQDIIYIEALEHYCNVFTTDTKKLLVRKSMKDWESILPNDLFMRIHRSLIINLSYVIKFEKWFNNSFRVYMKGIHLPFEVSRRFGSKIRTQIKF